MTILDEFSNMILIGLIVFSILAIILTVIVVLLRINGKAGGIYEEGKDYSMLQRMDSEDYLKFDDIKDRMIICDGGTRFVAAVRGYGFDFYRASAEVQAAVMQNFIGFINTITTPTMYRQHSKAIDVEHTMKLYERAYQKKEMELFEIAEDIRNITLSRSERVYTEEEKRLFEERLAELNRTKKAKEWQKDHLRDQMAKLRQSSGEHVDPERVQCWIFEWKYNTMDFTMDLTMEQIYEKAVRELDSMANAKIHALQNCKVRAVRCSTENLIEMTRRYSSPVTSNCFRMRDVLKSSFFDDFNYETDHDELIERAKESVKRSSSLDTLETFAENRKSRGLMPSGNLNTIGQKVEKETLTAKEPSFETEPAKESAVIPETVCEEPDVKVHYDAEPVPEMPFQGIMPPENEIPEVVEDAVSTESPSAEKEIFLETVIEEAPVVKDAAEGVLPHEEVPFVEDVTEHIAPTEKEVPVPVMDAPAVEEKPVSEPETVYEPVARIQEETAERKPEKKKPEPVEKKTRIEAIAVKQKKAATGVTPGRIHHTDAGQDSLPRPQKPSAGNKRRPVVEKASGAEKKREMMEKWLSENNIEEKLHGSK